MGLFPPGENTMMMRFRNYCKKVSKRKNQALLIQKKNRADKTSVFSDLAEGVLEQFYVVDRYENHAFQIQVQDVTVMIEDEMLYQALMLLPNIRREIILLSYFMDMTDKEIGERIAVPKSTVQYNRNVALRHMKKTMRPEGESDE